VPLRGRGWFIGSKSPREGLGTRRAGLSALDDPFLLMGATPPGVARPELAELAVEASIHPPRQM
jgi:hypothetical protein